MFWGKIKEVSRIVREVEIQSVIVPEGRIRRVVCDANLRALSDSIRKHGVLEPLIVRRCACENGDITYALIAGERRLKAAEMAGLVTVPTVSVEADEVEGTIIAIIENLHREDLSIFEEAAAIRSIIALTGMTQEMCARKLSVSQSYIANKMRLLKLSEEERELIIEKGLSERHARALLRLDEGEERRYVLGKIIEREMNVAKTEEYIEELICARERMHEKQEKPDVRKKLIIRDIRLFYNSIDKAVDVIKKSGIEVEATRREVDDGVLISILLPKKAV